MGDPVAPVVVGLDLSLTATGVAHVDGSTETYRPANDKSSNAGLDRICEIRTAVTAVTSDLDLELVVLEGLAFDAHDTNRWQAQLTGIVRASLFDRGIPFMVVSPGSLKKYATGNGSAGKPEVLNAAQKRLGYDGYLHDEADALWLRAIGWALLEVPVVDLPQTHRDALKVLRQQRPVRR